MADSNNRTIYVSTIIDSHNYGTVLQAVATRDILGRYGRPVFVDYCRPQWTRSGWAHQKMSGGRVNGFLKLAAGLGARLRSERVFRPFIEGQLSLCDAGPFLTGVGLDALDRDALFCVGSDQTWNIECNDGIDPVYFLERIPDDRRKVAFAASFGRPKLDDEEANLTRPLLSGFDAISVRERSSIDILDKMGIPGSVALKDPVLLCDENLWYRLSDCSRLPFDSGYVLLYMLNPNPDMISYTVRVSKELGVRACVVTFNPLRLPPHGLRAACLPTPGEWLNLFRNAGLVVTDSFHGTCFSLLFNRPMVVFDPAKFSVRLHDVLSDFDLLDRRVLNSQDAFNRCVHRNPIEWRVVNEGLKLERTKAREFLDSAFSPAS